jgi:hypothetical protein
MNLSIDNEKKQIENYIKGRHLLVVLQAVIAVCMTWIVASYIYTGVSYMKSCTLETKEMATAIVNIAIVTAIYIACIIYSGHYVSALLQKGTNYAVIYHRIDNKVAVAECELYYKGNPVTCTWEEKPGKKTPEQRRYILKQVSGEQITRKNRNAVKMYISEWAEHEQM